MNVTIVAPAAAPGFLALKPTAAAATSSFLNWYEAGPSVQMANMGVVTIFPDAATVPEFVKPRTRPT